MKRTDLLIVSKAFNDIFTIADKENYEGEIKRAKEYYSKDLELVTSHLENYPDNAEYWQSQIERYSAILAGGFEAITFEEYDKRQREKYLGKKPKEVTAKEFDDMLNVLPPLKWIRNERYSMFCVGECTTMTYYAQYLYDRESKKYYTNLVDIYDRSTWLDKSLGFVS
jgi:hypothetical protein